jgi:hypothetical protein
MFGGVLLLRSFFCTDSEKLLADFDSKDLSTEESRGRAVLEMRDKFHRLAERRRHMRNIGRGIALGLGVAEAVLGGVGLGQHHGRQRAPDYVLLTNAAIIGGLGALFIGVDHVRPSREPGISTKPRKAVRRQDRSPSPLPPITPVPASRRSLV